MFATFNRRASVDRLAPVIEAFEDGLSSRRASGCLREYVRWMGEVPGLHDAVMRLGTFDVTDGAEDPALVASAVEFLLEGLHLQRRLNKDRRHGRRLPSLSATRARLRWPS